jgi:hypothetical protein
MCRERKMFLSSCIRNIYEMEGYRPPTSKVILVRTNGCTAERLVWVANQFGATIRNDPAVLENVDHCVTKVSPVVLQVFLERGIETFCFRKVEGLSSFFSLS